MYAITVMLTTVLLALWPALIGAQCDQCEGDFNGDGKVTINEIIVAVNNVLNNCPPPGPRFTDNGDGTITDTKTGLQWEKKSDDGSIHDQDDTYTWSTGSPNHPDGTAFTSFLATLNSTPCFAGHCDWRLPTVVELQDLVDHGQSDPAVDKAVFDKLCTPTCTATTCSCTVPDAYWSATPVVDLPNSAWTVNFIRGIVTYYDDTTLPLYVRAVRGGS